MPNKFVMRTIKPWVRALGIDDSTFFSWVASIPKQDSITFHCLEKGLIRSGDYFAWAKDHYELPVVSSEYFGESANRDLWGKIQTVANWGPTMLPIDEWDGVVFVGVVEPPEDVSWSFPVRYVLANPRDLKLHHERLLDEPTKSSQVSIVIPPPEPEADAQPTPEPVSTAPEVAPSPPAVAQAASDPEASTSDFSLSSLNLNLTAPAPITATTTASAPSAPPSPADAGPEGITLNFGPELSGITEAPKPTPPAQDGPSGIDLSGLTLTKIDLSKIGDSIFNTDPAATGEIKLAAAAPQTPPPAPPEFMPEITATHAEPLPEAAPTPAPTPAPAPAPAVAAKPTTPPPKPTAAPASKPVVANPAASVATPTVATAAPTAPAPAAVAKPTAPPPPKPKPVDGAIDAEKIAPASFEAATSSDQAIAWIFQQMKQHFMFSWLHYHHDGKLKAWRWEKAATPVKEEALTPLDLSQASLFRIVARTKMPYHGHVVENPVNTGFFKNWGLRANPAHVTAIPVVMDGHLVAVLIGAGEKPADSDATLRFTERLAQNAATALSLKAAA